MDMRKYSGSSFIKFEDVKDGQREETIYKLTEGKFGKPNLLFESGRQFSLNTANNNVLIAAYGPNGQDWPGMRIKLYAGKTKFEGKEIDTVSVQPISPTLPEAERTPLPAEADDEIV